MEASLYGTLRFFLHLARDLAGTLTARWRRFYRRVVLGAPEAVVAVDIFPFFERMTGVGWYEWNLLAGLDRRQDGLFYNLYGPTFLGPDEAVPGRIPGGERMRLRLHQIPSGFLLPTRLSLAFLRGVVEPLLRVLDGNAVLFAPNFFAHRSQLPFGRSTVATVHDLAFAVMPETVSPATLAELDLHLPAALFRSERLIAVSDATAGDMVEHLGVSRRRIHTIHEAVDPGFGDLGTDTADPDDLPFDLPSRYLLFVSTIEPRKNVLAVLRAFRLAAGWGYPGELLLVGRWGWRTDSIRAELESSPVRARIRHLDYVERSQLPYLYRGAEALLFPSWLEGFGLPILEAMACGTPVVTSGRSAMPEVAGPAAVYVDPESAHGIASAVSSLVADAEHRQRLARMGRERATRFSWDLSAAATAQVLRQAAGLETDGADEYRV